MKARRLSVIDSNLIQKLYFITFCFLCVAIFLPVQLVLNIAIALLIVVWLVEGNFKRKWDIFLSSPLAIASVLLFLLYAGGLLYTANLVAGSKYLETKASLLIFPVIVSTAQVKKEYLTNTLYFFSGCCILFSLIALLYQVKVVHDLNDINYLFSDGLVLIYSKQAVYYSIYVAFSIFIILNKIWREQRNSTIRIKVLYFSSIGFLLFFLFLLASRTSLLALIAIVLTTTFVLGMQKGRLKSTLLLTLSLILFFCVLSFFFPQTAARFSSLKNFSFDFHNQASEYHFAFVNPENSWNGLNLRLAKWICAIDVIKANPVIGVGTGDIKDELVKAYIGRGFLYGAEKRFDPHNQFFETTVGIGIIGLIILVFFYFYPLYNAIKSKSWLFMAFALLIILCSLTESVLSSSQGIIFICFFMFTFTRLLEEAE